MSSPEPSDENLADLILSVVTTFGAKFRFTEACVAVPATSRTRIPAAANERFADAVDSRDAGAIATEIRSQVESLASVLDTRNSGNSGDTAETAGTVV